MNSDKQILKDLAKRYMELCFRDCEDKKRELWKKHNSLKKTSVPILCTWHAWSNVNIMLEDQCQCRDPELRHIELYLKNMIFHSTLGDDLVFEPWIYARAVLERPKGGVWGEDRRVRKSIFEGQAYIAEPVINRIEDIDKLVATSHKVDEFKTKLHLEKMNDIFGGVIGVALDRSPIYRCYGGSDISTALMELCGFERMMMDMYDNPKLLHKLAGFMRDAVLNAFDKAEAEGDFKTINHTYSYQGCVNYCDELPNPINDNKSISMKDLWFFTSAQEFTSISPQMHDEFVLQYQKPIMERFGLISYGCCEDLSDKIDMLRSIKNLRVIGVAPSADVKKCAEQIGRDYVMSYRPNPAPVCAGFSENQIRHEIREGLAASKGCNVHIQLKDISTVQGDPTRLKKWTDIARQESEQYV